MYKVYTGFRKANESLYIAFYREYNSYGGYSSGYEGFTKGRILEDTEIIRFFGSTESNSKGFVRVNKNAPADVILKGYNYEGNFAVEKSEVLDIEFVSSTLPDEVLCYEVS